MCPVPKEGQQSREGSPHKGLIVVIGAGPAGLVTAATFAQRGYSVDVYEKRPTPPDPSKEHHHSFTIVLNPKGLNAIRSTGVSTDHLLHFPLKTCVRHSPDGRYSQAFLEPKPGVACHFERSELTRWLYDSVCTAHPAAVRFHFGYTAVGLQLEQQCVVLRRTEGGAGGSTVSTVTARYDLLVGADGAHSAVRCLLQRQGVMRVQRVDAPLVYKRFKNIKCDLDLTGKYGPDGAVLHFFGVKLPRSNEKQRQAFSPTTSTTASAASPTVTTERVHSLPAPATSISTTAPASSLTALSAPITASASTASSSKSTTTTATTSTVSTVSTSSTAHVLDPQINEDTSPTAALTITSPWGFLSLVNTADGALSGGLSVYDAARDRLHTPQDYQHTLQALPLPAAVRQDLAHQLYAAPWSQGGAWVRCSQLHGPRVILLGDAAHAVSPSLGQGCNASLEDVTVLQQLLDELAAAGTATATTGSATAASASSRSPSPAASVPAASAKQHYKNPEDTLSTLPGSSSSGSTPQPAASSSSATLLDALPATFTARRLEDVHALVWLDEHARAFRGQMGYFNRYFLMYIAHMVVRPALASVLPGTVAVPALKEVWAGPVQYTAIQDQMIGDGVKLGLLGGGLLLGAAAAVGAALWRRS
mmetsp:Transcript_13708/g.29448  ORF Transcript_13708/g.29448 Transcript_13708/m.29448 type:complete len:647 (+) Transcript_13708:128-2068(+)|eukprot:CAMPEP_0202890904 /NCGR_PEP_ID=MMETSP1392-20130828/1153_1 /ASSEMBLY_ACC=CAM_ASM_000868 /TAXON_ID=225041 /ORGANISM="Chlamydomonas chlamydogama, Strain SAG 11-48b" /LENGTH=646 /DNA_ID=CAMNT_0049574555 /DNA_START=124 /DNA_END=2064 /DNA_ORIENTATION=+